MADKFTTTQREASDVFDLADSQRVFISRGLAGAIVGLRRQ